MSLTSAAGHSVLRTQSSRDARGSEPFPDLVLGRFVESLQPILRWASAGIGWLTFLGFLYLGVVHFDYALPFGVIAGSAWALMAATLRANQGGMPIVSMISAQHLLVYGLPLIVQNPSIERYPPGCLMPASIAFVIFIAAMGLGWRIGIQRRPPAPSKFFLAGGSASKTLANHVGHLGFGLLALGLTLQLGQFTGLYWSAMGDFGTQFFSTYQAIGLLACTSGAYLGAFASKRNPRLANLYWALWIAAFLLLISGVLLSAATGLVLATIAGLFIGGRRIPWVAVALILSVIAFLNLGKFDIRARYWGWADEPTSRITLQGLPAFYGQWISASFYKLTAESAPVALGHDTGQSLTDRIDNLQNLLFITDALALEGRGSLKGGGYATLPSVFVPRMVWPDKPRTHEGQAILNVHFGRQGSIDETEKTYVAWGLLPEAMGNLGMWMGPALLGLVLGGACGWAETWSTRKNLMSIEGLGASILLVSAAVSFEMSMGVLLAMLFQSALAIIIGGLALRSAMAR
jgi:hypothetical protein